MEPSATQDTATRTTTDADVVIDKFSDASVTVLKFSGVINETFGGRGLARSVRTPLVAIDLAGVSKISSFGVREWIGFVETLQSKARGVYLVGCSPKVVNQLNMVSGFAGSGRIYSFYAPYRCDSCGNETRVLMNVDQHHEVIASQRPEDRTCTACGSDGNAFDEDPVTYFSFVGQQPDFELPSEVATILVSRLGYSDLDLARRLRVEKIIEGDFTYLRFSGNLNRGLRYENIAEGLQGKLLVDLTHVGRVSSDGVADLHRLLKTAQDQVEQVLLLGVPGMILEKYLPLEEYSENVQVSSLTLPYTCTTTSTTESKLISVEQHWDVLRIGAAPQVECKGCDGPCVSSASTRLLSRLKELPRPHLTPAHRKFLKKVQNRKPKASAPPKGGQTRVGGMPPVLVVGSVVAAAVVAVVISYAQTRTSQRVLDEFNRTLGARMLERRPSWISSDTPFMGYCTDLGARMQCVGVSAFNESKDQAREEAEITALEALVHAIGLKVEDPDFSRLVRKPYGERRPAAIASWSRLGGTTEADELYAEIRQVRRAAAEGLRASGGAAVPAAVADWYWEEYKAEREGDSNEFLAFVRYDVSLDEVRALVKRYSRKLDVWGATVLSAFPGSAWIAPGLERGAMIVEVGPGPLRKMGLGQRDTIVALEGEPIRTAEDLAARAAEMSDVTEPTLSVLDPQGVSIGAPH